jgi:hypothetical protein
MVVIGWEITYMYIFEKKREGFWILWSIEKSICPVPVERSIHVGF